jgi:hypothetical protein
MPIILFIRIILRNLIIVFSKGIKFRIFVPIEIRDIPH